MIPFFLIRLLVIIVVITALTISVIIIMKYYYSLKSGTSPQSVPDEEKKVFYPLKLQAYERIVLFLERINPNSLIQRVSKPEMTPVQLQAALIKAIREEYEYNLSQQIYISSRSWQLVKNAKEEAIKLIHTAAGKVSEGSTSQELIRKIFDEVMAIEKMPADFALDEIKKELAI